VCTAVLVNRRDQRGVQRPQGPHCDIGAFELESATPINTPVGISVTVQPVDSTTGNTDVAVTFPTVTTPGITVVASSPTGPPAPANFE
jgi:hypothetical protein